MIPRRLPTGHQLVPLHVLLIVSLGDGCSPSHHCLSLAQVALSCGPELAL